MMESYLRDQAEKLIDDDESMPAEMKQIAKGAIKTLDFLAARDRLRKDLREKLEKKDLTTRFGFESN